MSAVTCGFDLAFDDFVAVDFEPIFYTFVYILFKLKRYDRGKSSPADTRGLYGWAYRSIPA